jgi:hypothetical protein
MPKGEGGQVDHHIVLAGPDLVEFVDQKLFPYLANFKYQAEDPQSLEYKVGEIFSELKYNAIADAKKVLGSPTTIRETFIGFQKYLYNWASA